MQEMLRSTIHDLSQCADMTKSIVDCFVLKELGIGELDEDFWSYDIAVEWVRLKLDDVINCRLKWAQSTNQSDALLERTILRFLRDEDDNGELLDRFYESLDLSELYINNLVQDTIGENEWRIWYLTYRNDWVVMEYGEDYRIKVFNEKVASGEWEV